MSSSPQEVSGLLSFYVAPRPWFKRPSIRRRGLLRTCWVPKRLWYTPYRAPRGKLGAPEERAISKTEGKNGTNRGPGAPDFAGQLRRLSRQV